MKIGIDARNLTSSQTGIARVVHQTARHLLLAGADVRLYLPAAPQQPLGDEFDGHLSVSDYKGAVRRMRWGLRVLPRLLQQDKIDVLWGPAHRLPSGLPKRMGRVLTIHDLVWKHAPETMQLRHRLSDRILMGVAVRQADMITAVSDYTKSTILGHYPTAAGRTVVVHPGFTALPDTGAPLPALVTGRYILFVGTIEPRKNINALLNAYQALPAHLRDMHPLVLAGHDGWKQRPIAETLQALGLSTQVIHLGPVKDATLAALYRHCHFLAMPSLYEGFGLPLIEANAFGKPTLTSDRASLPEVGGAAAVLVDPASVASITHGLLSLLQDKALYARLAAAAPGNANRFRWETAAQEMTAVFEDSVRKRR